MCLGPLGHHNDSIFNLREERSRIAFCLVTLVMTKFVPFPPFNWNEGTRALNCTTTIFSSLLSASACSSDVS